MSNRERWKQVQAVIGTTQDGVPGKKDAAALEKLREAALSELREKGPKGSQELVGRRLRVFIEGNDLVLRNVRATCFGGTNDPQDSGDTASGVSTKPPGTLGVALPRNYTGSHGPTRRALQGSPIPESLPWKTMVEVIDRATGKKGTFPFIDLGPNLESTSNAVDLTVAAAKQFHPKASATSFEMMCDVRIIGGAKFL